MKSLNHIFRTIWSEALNTWIAVSENTPSKGKSRSCVLNGAELADNDSEAGNIVKPGKRLRLNNSAYITVRPEPSKPRVRVARREQETVRSARISWINWLS